MNSLWLVFSAVFCTVAVHAIQVDTIVISPAAHGTQQFGISVLTAKFVGMPSAPALYPVTSTSFAGNANFNADSATVTISNQLKISFSDPYLHAPACQFSFRDYDGQVQMETTNNDVFLKLRTSSGCESGGESSWIGKILHFSLVCYGVHAP